MPALRSSSRLALSNSRTSPDAKSAVNPTLNGLDILHLRNGGGTKSIHHPANRACQQPAIGADTDHLKPLLQSHSSVLSTCRHHSAGKPGGADTVFHTQNFFGHSRTFPLTRIAGRGRKICRSEEQYVHIRHLENRVDVPGCLDMLDDRYHKRVLVGR